MHKNVSRPKSTAFQLQTQVRHTQRNYDSNASVVLALGDRHAVSKIMKHPKANSALIRQRSIFEAWQTWRSSELVDILSYFFSFFAINLFFSFSPFSFFLFNGFWGSLVYQYPNFFCRRIVLVRFVWASVLASNSLSYCTNNMRANIRAVKFVPNWNAWFVLPASSFTSSSVLPAWLS